MHAQLTDSMNGDLSLASKYAKSAPHKHVLCQFEVKPSQGFILALLRQKSPTSQTEKSAPPPIPSSTARPCEATTTTTITGMKELAAEYNLTLRHTTQGISEVPSSTANSHNKEGKGKPAEHEANTCS